MTLAAPTDKGHHVSDCRRLIAATLTASRWLMAPLYLGLIAALAIILVEFYRELARAVVGFVELTPDMVRLGSDRN